MRVRPVEDAEDGVRDPDHLRDLFFIPVDDDRLGFWRDWSESVVDLPDEHRLFGAEDVFTSKDDPGYQLLASWIAGETAPASCTPTVEVGP